MSAGRTPSGGTASSTPAFAGWMASVSWINSVACCMASAKNEVSISNIAVSLSSGVGQQLVERVERRPATALLEVDLQGVGGLLVDPFRQVAASGLQRQAVLRQRHRRRVGHGDADGE